jgi:hypothetical protein
MKNLDANLRDIQKLEKEISAIEKKITVDLSPIVDMIFNTTEVFGELFKQDEKAEYAVLKTMTKDQKEEMIRMFEEQYIPMLAQFNKSEKLVEVKGYIEILKENLAL